MPALQFLNTSLGRHVYEAPCLLPSKDILLPFVEDHFVEKHRITVSEYSLPSWQKQVEDRKKEDKRTRKSGDSIVAEINYWLDNVGIKRHDYQIYFHQKIIESCLPKIYEHEWATFESEILQKFNIVRVVPERFLVCPRRFGKTYSVGSYAACYAWCVPNSEEAIFSTGKRTSGKLMTLTVSFLLAIPGFREKCETHNVEMLVIEMSSIDKRKICCYPGSVAVRLSLLFVCDCGRGTFFCI